MRTSCRPTQWGGGGGGFERRNKIVQQFKMKVTRAKNMCIWWCMTKVCVAAFAFVASVCVSLLVKDSCGRCLT